MNQLVIFILFAYFGFKSVVYAEDAICSYNTSYIRLKQNPTLVYGCKLRVNALNESLTDITGQHVKQKDDSDVEVLNKVSGSILTHFTSKFCDKFENLQVIVLPNAKIQEIDENSFEKCQKLKVLDLKSNKIREISHELFSRNAQLVYLNLDSNKLNRIHQNSFSNLNQLEHLHLSRNRLAILDPVWFEKFQKLKTLILSSNEIRELPEKIFSNLSSLEALDLSSNNLTSIHSDSFGILQKLKIVNLSKNKISETDQKFIDSNTAIEMANFESNICINKKNLKRVELKEELKKCFENYKPRHTKSFVSVKSLEEQCDLVVLEEKHQIMSKLKECFGIEYGKSPEKERQTCGRVKIGRPLVFHGEPIQRGAFPWIAALLRTENSDFFGEGTLISKKHVITSILFKKFKFERKI